MVRRHAPVLLCVAVCLFAAHMLSTAQATSGDALPLSADESQIRVALEGGETRASLKLFNRTGQSLRARVAVEVIDPRGAVRASAFIERQLARGANTVVIPLRLPFAELREAERAEFPWYRLRYVAEASGLSPVEGLVSFSEIVPDLYELSVVSARRTRGGTTYRARVRTVNPVSRRAVAGVHLSGTLSFDYDKPVIVRATGLTDRDGFASLDFELPRAIGDSEDDGELKVTARRGPFEQTAQSSVEINEEPRVLLITDKSLYQPGQTVHLRALAFDSSERALADEEITFIVEDEEGETVFRAEARSTRFGIASVDWPVAENARLGQYTAKVEMGDGRYSNDYQATHDFRISRYDLPNFSVTTRADRTFYLNGQNAEIEVRADYLFGQPVKRGRVRVVMQSDRRWNYAEQKYEVEEKEPVEGLLDEEGRFIARLKLDEKHDDLAGAEWSRFNDVNFAAYVTDPTTNRTEQRRFRLRLTKEPIHVYVNEGRFRQAKGLPLAFYVSTFYADGTPAECDVTVFAVGETRVQSSGPNLPSREIKEADRTLFRIKTNRYGVAKAVGPIVRADEERRNLPLRFVARDRNGRTGTQQDDLWLHNYYSSDERTVIRVETDKTLYRAGETIEVSVASNRRRAGVVVDLTTDGRVVASRGVRLDGDGRATLSFPYREDFIDAVRITATAIERSEDSYGYNVYPRGTKTVIFPRNRELKLDVKLAQASYRPGEQAAVEFAVRTPDGRRTEGALGVVVFDKAVEERARTEDEFGRPFGFGGSLHALLYGRGDIAGITRREIEQIDLRRNAPMGIETVAELLFNGERSWYDEDQRVSTGIEFDDSPRELFRDLIARRLAPMRAALNAHYERSGQYPFDRASLDAALAAAGLDFASLRDPWGQPYRVEFHTRGEHDLMEIKTDGADERAATGDEMTVESLSWPYFNSVGERINRAASERHARTGEFIRDISALKDELRRTGFDLDSLRDRWGQRYAFDFEVSGACYAIAIRSSGPNRAFERQGDYSSDDFTIWRSLIDYFAGPRKAVDEALARIVSETGTFPRDEAALVAALSRSGIRLGELRDGWGRPVRALFSTSKLYGDRIRVESRGQYDPAQTLQRTELTPVTRTVFNIVLRSAGADAMPGTPDDFTLAAYTSIGAERAALDASTQDEQQQPNITFSGGAGAITGKVTDPQGAVVAGVTVNAAHRFSDLVFEAKTDHEGIYLLRNLPSGFYLLTIEATGFSRTVIENVQVQSSNLTRADVTLNISDIVEMVTVTANRQLMTLNMTSATVSEKVERAVVPQPQLSTPRLREFFPETLVWQPSLETDASGRARMDFKLADNITTWKISVIASTADGRLGTVEREFLAFQPFFAEHDPPRVLTEGDVIRLPVVLRNYLERAQTVSVEMKPESWFTLIGAAQQSASVPAGDAARPTFGFRAVASIKDGKQRVTARGGEASDAIEKPVTVHPDGEERSRTDAAIFVESGALGASVPSDAIEGSIQSELKIYPNLAAHIVEGVEAIMSRPYGCGEQTISSAYPSIFVLNFYRHARGTNEKELPAGARRAERYARLGYERLLSYRAVSGGFTYWGRGEADLALTAYALRFLSDASRVIEVDERIIRETRDYLIRHQRRDGSWPAPDWGGGEDPRRTALNTAFVARVLAATGRDVDDGDADRKAVAQVRGVDTGRAVEDGEAQSRQDKGEELKPLARALGYLLRRAAEIDEPYLIASYALAAADAGDADGAASAVARLRSLARDEGTGTYWALETNTPFYGWGRAGRIETTALAVQALARASGGSQQSNDERSPDATRVEAGRRDAKGLIERGLLFLLDNKDRYGVWLSTQATINVLDTLLNLSLSAERDERGSGDASDLRAEVFINDRRAGEIQLPPAGELSAPVVFNLSPFITAGDNRIEIRRNAGAARAQAQVVTSYYVPWPARPADAEASSVSNESDAPGSLETTANVEAARRNNSSSLLRLAISFDRREAEINQEINCRVSAERVGHRGYGMLLAEVGLPPGADVDRASLERAVQETGWAVSRYDIQPDRLVLYLWPRSGGVNFTFKFRPRYGLEALTAPSQLYDYYNPDARAVLAPTRFVVR